MLKDPLKIFQKSPQWPQVKKICQTLEKEGHIAWLAGGSVRDALLGIKPKDFDIATSATPEQVETLFPKTVAVGKSFGVIKIVTKNGDFEVASFRKDGLYIDGRRPESVEFSSPQEDALRRDFTINALFYDIKSAKIHDFVGGITDINGKILRTVGEPSRRFDEDKLRILRAVRFVSQLGFELDSQTLGAVRRLSTHVSVVSGERLFAEMTKLFNGKFLRKALPIYLDVGLHNVLFNSQNLDLKLFNKDFQSKNPVLIWALLFSSFSDYEKRREFYLKLKVSGEFQKSVEEILRLAEKIKAFPKLSKAEKRRMAAADLIKEAQTLVKLHGIKTSGVAAFISKNKKLPKPFIDSDLLNKHKVRPGSGFGLILKNSYELQLEGKLKTRGQAVKWLEKTIEK